MGNCLSGGKNNAAAIAAAEREALAVLERAVFGRYSLVQKDKLTRAELAEFLMTEQRELVPDQNKLPEARPQLRYSPYPNPASMTFTQALDTYVLDVARSNPIKRVITQDLSRPLSEYWINSSSKTYLSVSQVSSRCDPLFFSHALLQGCRVVEIDCYDHDQLTLGTTLKPGQGPVVMHGGTLTAPTLLSACLAEIRKSAFVASEYPVIISLANHCSPEGQAEIAEMLEATFGRELYIPPTVPENLTAFPSPEQLKRKVVLRDRTLPPRDDDAATEGESVSSKHGTSRTGESGSRRRSKKQRKSRTRQPGVSSQKPIEAPELLRLVAINSVEFKGFAPPCKHPTSSCLADTRVVKLLAQSALTVADCLAFSRRHLGQVFPSASRASASNYDPCPAWEAGLQMASLNFQDPGRANHVNAAKFRGNGGCGYVLKPPYMLGVEGTFPQCVMLTIELLGCRGWDAFRGADNSLTPPDSYVNIIVQGGGTDKSEKRSSTFQGENFTGPLGQPFWGESFTFIVADVNQAVLVLEACDEDVGCDYFLGQYGVPVLELLPGVRTFPLLTSLGQKIDEDPVVVCRIGIEPISRSTKRHPANKAKAEAAAAAAAAGGAPASP